MSNNPLNAVRELAQKWNGIANRMPASHGDYMHCADELLALADRAEAESQRDGREEQWKPTETQLSALFALMMCSDPWPVADNAGLDTMHAFCDELAAKLGFSDWAEAYHALPSPEPRT